MAQVLIHLKRQNDPLDGGVETLDYAAWGLPQARPFSETTKQAALRRLNDLTKPKGSLGQLEALIADLAGLQGRVIPVLNRPHFLVFVADHGVATNHAVSRYGQAVTEEMAVNIAMNSSVSAVMARHFGIALDVFDVGCIRTIRHPNIHVKKVAQGTRDFTLGPAMDDEQLTQAMNVGVTAASQVIDAGADCLILGEMGIGNTTAASALAAWLLDLPAQVVVGVGTGIDDATLNRKAQLVQNAVEKWRRGIDQNQLDSFAKLRSGFTAFGGFELAAMAGAMLAGAARGVPTLLDGFLAGISGLWATMLEPGLRPFLIAAHESPEPAHRMILAAMSKQPLLSLGMRVGEGAGALLAWPMVQTALKVMAETATFDDARVTNPHRQEEKPKPLHQVMNQDHPTMSSEPGPSPMRGDFTAAEVASVYKVIAARRDIRVFLPDKLPANAVARILAAGHHGPSVGYMQPWNFIVIDDKTVLRSLQAAVDRERLRAGRHYPDEKRDYYLRLKVEGLVEAPLTLCVTNDSTRGGPHVLGRNTIPETDLMSTSCAIQNMWLAARAEGIGMGWVSIYEKSDVREILRIPAHIDPVALLTIGYTPHFPEIPVLERVGWGKRIDLGELLYHNQWGEAVKEEWH